MKKKVIIIIAVVCVAIIAVVGTIFGVNAYNNYTIQQQTEQQDKSIDDTYSKFTKETDRAKKLVILSDFIKNKPSTSDEIKVEVLNSVEPKYNETLAKMQKFFTDDYDKTIKDNTIDSKTLEKTNDKKKLQSCIDNLEALKKTIDSEKSDVFYKNDIGNYDKKPDELISSYNDRITAIEKAEAKAKKEAEAKKKAEEKAKQEKKKQTESSNTNNTDNSYSDNTNSYSDSENNYDSGNNNYSSNDSNYSGGNNSSSSSSNYSYWSYTNENGTYYHDSNGNKWDSNGNKYEYDPDDDINSWGYPEDE
uniref:hypothetical protein n=1 Tax=Ruminococcus bromii TaxID=40518 RepID=UPI003FED9F8F